MKTIVLVEDDYAIRDSFSLMLSKCNYKLISLADGELILNNEVETPALFILDKNLAGVDGMDLCRHIRSSERYGNVPVIMISASPDVQIWAERAGANDALEKPYSINTIRKMIAKYAD